MPKYKFETEDGTVHNVEQKDLEIAAEKSNLSVYQYINQTPGLSEAIDNYTTPANAKDGFKAINNIINNVDRNTKDVRSYLANNYFDLSNMERQFSETKAMRGGKSFPIPGISVIPYFKGLEYDYKNDLEVDQENYFGKEKYEQYLEYKDNGLFLEEWVGEKKMVNAINAVQEKRVIAYEKNIDSDDLRTQINELRKTDLYENITDAIEAINIIADGNDDQINLSYKNNSSEIIIGMDGNLLPGEGISNDFWTNEYINAHSADSLSITETAHHHAGATGTIYYKDEHGKPVAKGAEGINTDWIVTKEMAREAKIKISQGGGAVAKVRAKHLEHNNANLVQINANYLNNVVTPYKEGIVKIQKEMDKINSKVNEMGDSNAWSSEDWSLYEQLKLQQEGLQNMANETFEFQDRKYNEIIKLFDINGELWKDIDNSGIIAKAYALDYNFSTRAGLAIEEGFVDMAGLALFAAAGAEKYMPGALFSLVDYATKGDGRMQRYYEAVISYNQSLKEYKQAAVPLPVKWDELKFSGPNANYGEAMSDILGDNIFSIGSALLYGGVLTKTGKLLTGLTTRQATGLLSGTFFSLEGGAKLSEMEIAQNYAQENIDFYEGQLQRIDLTPDVRLDYYNKIDEAQNALNASEFQKGFSALLYGGIAMYAERMGTMRYVRQMGKFSDVVGPISFGGTVRTVAGYGYRGGIEYTEEVITQIGHNLSDNLVNGKNKSLVDGIDADFAMNVIFSTLAIQAPGVKSNVVNTIRSIVATKEQRQKYRENAAEVISILAQIKKLEEGQNPNIERTELEIAELDYLKSKLGNIFRDVAFQDSQLFANIGNMTNNEIRELFELERSKQPIFQQAQAEGALMAGEPDDINSKNRIKKLQQKLDEIDQKQEQLTSKPSERIREDFENLETEKKVTAEDHFYMGQYENSKSILTGIDGKYKEITANKEKNTSIDEELEVFLDDLVKKKKITEEGKQNIIKRFSISVDKNGNVKLGAGGVRIAGVGMVLHRENIMRNILNAPSSYLKSASAYVAFHEQMHINDASMGITRGGEVTKENETAVKEIENWIEKEYNSGRLKKEIYQQFKTRLDGYKKNGKYLSEIMPLLAELMQAGAIKEETSLSMSLKLLFNRSFGLGFGDNSKFFKLNNAKDVIAYVSSFRKGVRNLSPAATEKEEELLGKVQASEGTPLEAINALLPNDIKTKEDYNNFIKDPKRNTVLFDALKDNGVISNYVKSRATSDEIPLILENVSDRMIGLIGEGFNPEAKRKDGTIVGQEGFGEYIFANTRFGKLDARKSLAIKSKTKKQTKSIDAAKPTSEGEVGFDLEDTKQLTPEEQMIQKEEQEKVLVKLESELKKVLNLSEQDINKIIASVKKNFGTALPSLTQPKKYRLALQQAFENDLKNVIQPIFGREKDYDKFLETFIPILHKLIPKEKWIQIERLVPKGKKIFATRRRITKTAEVLKLQSQNLLPKNAKAAQGPWLTTLSPTPSTREIMAFFRGKYKNPDTGVVETMQDILGYTVKKSAFGTRKDGIAKATSVELAETAAIDVVQNDREVYQRRRDVDEIVNKEQLDNDIELIAKVLGKDPNTQFSDGVLLDQYSDLLENIEKLGFVKVFDNNGKPTIKYGKQQYSPDIYEPVYELGLKGKLHSQKDLNKIIKRLFENVRILADNNLGDVGERVIFNMFKKLKILAPGFALSEKKVYIKPFHTFEGGNFQNADIVFVLKNGMEVALEIKFAVDGVVNAGKINVKDYNTLTGEFTLRDDLPSYVTDAQTKAFSKTMKVAKELTDLFNSDEFGYKNIDLKTHIFTFSKPKAIIIKGEVIQTKGVAYSPNGKIVYYMALHGKPVWHPKVKKLKAKSNQTTIVGGRIASYHYNKKGNFYIYFIGKGVYYLGDDPLQLEKSLGVAKLEGNFIFKTRLWAVSNKTDKKPKTGYKLQFNGESVINTNDITTNTEFNITGQNDVNKLLIAANNSIIAQLDQSKEIAEKIANQASMGVQVPKGITILDFDDTLATTKSLVKYTTPDGKTGTLNAEEFASTYEDLLGQGYEFDFTDFNKVVKGKLAPLFQKALKLQGKFGSENMFVLTARPPQAAKAIHDFLKANGLNIPIKNITGLANSTSEAKALWVAERVGEGYNNFYFADDALQNVQAVDNMLNQFDVKRKVQQAKVQFSDGINVEFNKILENITGVDSKKRFSAIKARKRGASKGKFRFFIPPSHEDLVGLLYNFIGKGKIGDAHRDFWETALIRPLNRAYREINTAKQSIANDYKSLNKHFPNVKKKLTKKTPDGDFTYQDAIRVYLWDKHGHKISGLSKTDQAKLIELVKNDPDLLNFAETLNVISKQDKYVKPTENWETGDIRVDLDDATGRVGREQFFAEFFENADIIFSDENFNKIEAAYGAGVVSAFKDILYRTRTGRNRPSGQNEQVNKWMNYLNGSVAATMFFNIRSAVLQQMSMVNFINFADNNIFAAAKAFANQKQYWSDWATIFNSDFMKQRRGGIKTDINGADLAASLRGAKNTPRALLAKLLELGFLPTQIGDNIAIATGGSTFYRNRINTYLKQGLSQKEAESKAWIDFQVLAEATQQSARPDMVSQQQASALGKIILAFQNVTSQFNRIGKKAFLDIKNKRITPGNTTLFQSNVSNLSRIAYYFAIQNLIFYSLQTALFAAMFDDDEDDERLLKKKERILNGTIDSILRGAGVWGAVVATIKNMAIASHREREKDWNGDESSVLVEALNLSPPLGIKARKLVNAEKTLNYNKKVIKIMETFDIDNPMWSAYTSRIEAVTNIPLNRLYNKTQNIRQALNNQNSAYQRALMFMGWSQYNLGIENQKMEDIKNKSKKKKSRKVKFTL